MANIVITIRKGEEEKKYKLEFTRRTILKLEEDGVMKNLKKGGSQEALDSLVYYACLKNHPNISKEEAMDIIDNIGSAQLGSFVEAVGDLLEKSLAVIEQGKEGNAHWEVN